MSGNLGKDLGTAMGGMVKAMTDIAYHYDAVAKWASTTPKEEWLQTVRDDPAPQPPYGVPPHVFIKLGWGMNERRFQREMQALYKRRTKAPEFANFLFRPFPPDLSVDDITFVGPDAGMSLVRLAHRALDVQIAKEEAVDFPNNLTPEQRATLVEQPSDNWPVPKPKPGLRTRIADAIDMRKEHEANLDADSQLLARAEAKLADGDVVGYWTVLAEERPLADLALRVATNQGFPAEAANDRLQMKAVRIFGQEFTDKQMAAIRLQEAEADLKLRQAKHKDGDGIGLTSDEVIRYHKEVFEGEKLPVLTFAPEAFAKVIGPLWSVVLDGSTEEVLEDGMMLTALKVYAQEVAQLATSPGEFLNDWVQVMEVASDAWPTLGRHLKQTLDAAHEAMIDLGQEFVSEPENLVSRNPALDDSIKSHKLSVFYDYSSFIGHFFVELRTDKNETFYFGKYPKHTFESAERDVLPFLVRAKKIGLGNAVQAALRDFAMAIGGPSRISNNDDRKLLREAGKSAGGPALLKVIGAKKQISKAQNEIALSKAEFERLKKIMVKRQFNPKNYILVWDNCATFVEDTLEGRVSLEELFPLSVRIQSLAGLYVTLFPEHIDTGI